MTGLDFLLLAMVLSGLFTIAAGIANWDWYFNGIKARPLITLMGRQKTRVFHVLLGFALIIWGILIWSRIV